MVKIGILTFHRALNYGAVFQTVALNRSIRKLGFDCEVIDYRNKSIEDSYSWKRLRLYLRPKKLASVFLKNDFYLFDRTRFDVFLSKYSFISKEVYNTKNIGECVGRYSHFISGSDQVLNPKITDFDSTFLLDFVPESAKKATYAASLGMTSVEGLEAFFKPLQKLDIFSVREEKTVDLLGHLNGRSVVSCDPVFLLSKKEWQEMESPDKTFVAGKFIFVYLLDENKEILSFVRKLAKEKKIPAVYINDRLFPVRGVSNHRKTSPETWLWLLDNCDCVVTNSFHGTALSMLFEKTAYVGFLKSNKQANVRIESLLKLGGVLRNGDESTVGPLPFKCDFGNVIKDSLHLLEDFANE